MNVTKILITIGIILILVGLMWPWLQKLGLFQLPGDIRIERGNTKVYFPITTMIILSIVLSFIMYILRR